jgi:succinyl-diaminopimelate desuccinylase
MSEQSAGLELTRRLVAFETVNPPGNERPCIEHIAGLLTEAGFEASVLDFGPGRANLVARLPATRPGKKPLVFSGHVDTVPLGHAPWSVPPFEGVVKNGRIYGRGTSDMKSGVAACVLAARELARLEHRAADLLLAVTAAEETGSEGAARLAAEPGLLGECGALLVAEPTDNRPLVGHKGAMWMRLAFSGVTAHGSMPDKGVSAIAKACRAVETLLGFDFGVPPHPVMGPPTINIGTIAGGMNINSVPDHAVIGVDVRTIAGQANPAVREQLLAALPDEAEVEPLADLGPVFTDPDEPWVRQVFAQAERVFGRTPKVETAAYFTDASVLTPACGNPPTIIMGPGPMAMAHQTDEYCEVAEIDRCVAALAAIGRDYLQ